MKVFIRLVVLIVTATACCPFSIAQKISQDREYAGKYFSGTGDTAYLHLLDQAYRMMQPDPELENLSMLYKPEWNGFVEGPTWKYWWIQNSFGPTYAMLPFMDRAYQTFIYNSQALWFNVIGNGRRADNNHFVGPKGVLVDCARDSPTDYYCKQGDYQVNIHDWGFGFTAAGILLEAELMLVRRDTAEIRHYLPLLEESAEFVDSRRDTVSNLFLVGTAANLLAPGYAGTGVKKEDGTYGKAYLAEISVNYIAALNRLTELEKMTGRKNKVRLYTERIKKIKTGLSRFTTKEGYFIRSLDPDGTRHGEYGAARHGYFETTPNQDAMAFRIVGDDQALRIYQKIRSIPGLRMHKLILPNYPSYDDMYDSVHLFHFGDWVNGGHWTTCEARMQIGYYRVNAFDDARAAFEIMLDRAYHFRLDNPLKDFGSKEYQPDLPVNCVYDSWGAPGGFLRGLFEYEYTAAGLTLYPHIPPGIHSLRQNFPIYLGNRKIFVSVHGKGEITAVSINSRPVNDFTRRSVFLKAEGADGEIYVSIGLGGALPLSARPSIKEGSSVVIPDDQTFWNIDLLREPADSARTPDGLMKKLKTAAAFCTLLQKSDQAACYEEKHAELILKSVRAIYDRRLLKTQKKTGFGISLSGELAADQLYIDAVVKQTDGLIAHLATCRSSQNRHFQRFADLWDRASAMEELNH